MHNIPRRSFRRRLGRNIWWKNSLWVDYICMPFKECSVDLAAPIFRWIHPCLSAKTKKCHIMVWLKSGGEYVERAEALQTHRRMQEIVCRSKWYRWRACVYRRHGSAFHYYKLKTFYHQLAVVMQLCCCWIVHIQFSFEQYQLSHGKRHTVG